ncbi:hypothetical protein HDU77_007731 [Chytriomyces hyalinus]|nr:hypothetical protein HDU77_007731 [Chytriomyces hyalinus]
MEEVALKLCIAAERGELQNEWFKHDANLDSASTLTLLSTLCTRAVRETPLAHNELSAGRVSHAMNMSNTLEIAASTSAPHDASLNCFVTLSQRQALLLRVAAFVVNAGRVSMAQLESCLSNDSLLIMAVILAAFSADSKITIENLAMLHHFIIRQFVSQRMIDIQPNQIYIHEQFLQSLVDDFSAMTSMDMDENSNTTSKHVLCLQIRYDLAELYFATDRFALAARNLEICLSKFKLLASQSIGISLARAEKIYAVALKLSPANTIASQPPQKPSTLISWNQFVKNREFGASFVNLVLNDFKDASIPVSMKLRVVNHLFESNLPEPAVKLAFMNALFAAQRGVAAMETSLPYAFYKHLRKVSSSSISALVQILSKFVSIASTPPSVTSASVCEVAIRFTWNLLHRIGTAEAFRVLTKSNIFEPLGRVNVEAMQRSCWRKNAPSINFSLSNLAVNELILLKRKLRATITQYDLDGLSPFFSTAKQFLIGEVERFCEKNQFAKARAFIGYISSSDAKNNSANTDTNRAVQMLLLGWISDELQFHNSAPAAFKDVYGLIIQSLSWSPQAPADIRTCRLILSIALHYSNDQSAAFLEDFVVKSEQVLQSQLLNNQPYESIKLVSILAKVCRRFVRMYQFLKESLAHTSEKDVGSIHALSEMQQPQMAEVREFAKEVLVVLSPGLHDAAFVKEFQSQLILTLNTAENRSFNRIFGSVVAGFLTALMPPAFRIQLRNFGPLAYFVCPWEMLQVEEEPWAQRIANYTKTQTDFSSLMQLDGGYLCKFLIRLYALTPPATTASSTAPTDLNSFCKGDLSMAIGDVKTALKWYLHGLSQQSNHFANFDACKLTVSNGRLHPHLLGHRNWNARLVHICLVAGFPLEGACIAQMVEGGPAAMDYKAAYAALDVFMDGEEGRNLRSGREMERVFWSFYEPTLLEYVICSFKKRGNLECVDAAVRLIGRLELGSSGVDEVQQRMYICKLQKSFFQAFAHRVMRQCLETFRFHEGTVYSLDVFFADDYNIASAGFERVKTGASSKRVAPEDSRTSRPITLLSGSHDQTISIATVRKITQPYGLSIQASKTSTLKGHTSDVYALEVLPEASTAGNTAKLGHFISAGDYTVRTWDLETQLPNSILSGHTGYVSCIKVRGKRAFSGSWDTTIRSWNLETGKPMHVFKGQHANIVNCIDVTTSDLFSGSWDQTIVQWSRATGDAVQSFRGHTDGVQCLQVYNDCLVSGSMDKTLRIWSISTGKTVRVIKGHTGGIECLHVVDDVCFTGSYDKTTGECLLVYQGHTDGIYCLKYFDGLLFSGSGDKSIRVWDASFLQKQVPAAGTKGPLGLLEHPKSFKKSWLASNMSVVNMKASDEVQDFLFNYFKNLRHVPASQYQWRVNEYIHASEPQHPRGLFHRLVEKPVFNKNEQPGVELDN